ncbi:hypothetical protein FC87_GL000501 [Fructilactobacillus florum DSM 22689 = JCM 16035]|uniref:Uncharacterized protein n=1 Tax=Fructilactobacillus florum DSM 22689 = JCM 16035 TaxID=1423745 RepID=A0A0R2CMH2_9LACO|nr:hypothetical protein FC87_GL000501 [Fructilactobacillus florum DSM 22689 = JCM 16035]
MLLGGGWYAGSQLYSRQRQIDQLMIGIKNNQNKVIMQKLTSTAGVKVNAQSVRPLLSYYQQHPQQLTRLQRDLEQHGSSTAGFLVVKHGRYWGIFPKYQVQAQAVHPLVQTEKPKVTIRLNQQKVGQTADDGSLRLAPQLPGRYQLSAELRNAPQVVKNTQTVNLFKNQPQVINLRLPLVSYTALGPAGAQVIAAGQVLGTIGSDGRGQLDNVPLTATRLVIKTPTGTLTSEPHHLTSHDQGRQIRYRFANIATSDQARTLLQAVWSGVLDATNDQHDLDGQLVKKKLVRGSDGDAYQPLQDLINHNHEQQQLYRSLELEIMQVQPLAEKQTQVDYQLQTTLATGETQRQNFRAVIERDLPTGQYQLAQNQPAPG